MQTNYERYCKMSSLAQIGWWEADFLAGHYVCSDFLCDLLGLEGDTISFMDFQNLIREDYREQIVQEFRANANIHIRGVKRNAINRVVRKNGNGFDK